MADQHIDEVTGVETTGHEWDGIRELNNPLPRWWVIVFYACIVWALAYTIFYPAWPLIHGATPGLLGYSTRGELASDLVAAKADQAAIIGRIASMPIEEVAADRELNQFALAAGAAAFKVNCTPCHGSGAEGGKGYPNLNDDDWLWGGSLQAIQTTVLHGIRALDDPDTRVSEMPAFGEMLEPQQVREVAAYVVSLTGESAHPEMVEPGKQVFAENCAACHGEDGRGNRELGAPNLADAIWLKADGEAGIARQVVSPKHGVMPAWGARLGETTVKELSIYVHSLGGGE